MLHQRRCPTYFAGLLRPFLGLICSREVPGFHEGLGPWVLAVWFLNIGSKTAGRINVSRFFGNIIERLSISRPMLQRSSTV